MIGESYEVVTFKEIMEMSQYQVKGKKLMVKGAIFSFCRSELFAEEGQWLP